MSNIHVARFQPSSMSIVGDITTATQRSRNAPSTVSVVSARQTASEALVDRAAEQSRSHLRRIRRVVGLWLRRRNDRVMLRSLSPRDIHDFCPKYSEAEAEMNKPFWQE